jgi:predicted TIM-barrel fold metal-dependent hydrolase
MPEATTRIVDAHVHLGESVYGESQNVDELLRQMDAHGVDMSIATAFTPPGLDWSRANALVAKSIQSHLDRLLGAVRVDPRLGAACRDEIRKGFETYGSVAIALHPAEQGVPANHPLVKPVIELAAELGLLVHFATGYPVFSTPFQIAALAVEYPTVNFVLGNMGLNTYLYDVIQACKVCPNLYAETAGHVVTGEVKNGIRMTIDAVGPTRILFASDSPYFDLGVERIKVRVAQLPASSEERILGGNILALLGEKVSARPA